MRCTDSYTAGKSKDQRRKFQSHHSADVYAMYHLFEQMPVTPNFTEAVTKSFYWPLCTRNPSSKT